MGISYRARENERVVRVEPYADLPLFSDFADMRAAEMFYEDAYNDLKHNVLGCLSKAWSPVRNRKWVTRDELVLAESALLICTLEEDSGGYGYVFVKITARCDLDCPPNEDFLMRLVDRSSQYIFGRLANIYDLSIPLGYVSAPYVPVVENAQTLAA